MSYTKNKVGDLIKALWTPNSTYRNNDPKIINLGKPITLMNSEDNKNKNFVKTSDGILMYEKYTDIYILDEGKYSYHTTEYKKNDSDNSCECITRILIQ